MRSTRVVVDACLLVVLTVGRCRKDLLGKMRRLKEYMPEDYDLLERLIAQFQIVLVTPNSVTECSNLFADDRDGDFARESLRELLANGDVRIAEKYIPSTSASQRSEYIRLGTGDCANLSLIDERTALVTNDRKLAEAAAVINNESINFNHYRSYL